MHNIGGAGRGGRIEAHPMYSGTLLLLFANNHCWISMMATGDREADESSFAFEILRVISYVNKMHNRGLHKLGLTKSYPRFIECKALKKSGKNLKKIKINNNICACPARQPVCCCCSRSWCGATRPLHKSQTKYSAGHQDIRLKINEANILTLDAPVEQPALRPRFVVCGNGCGPPAHKEQTQRSEPFACATSYYSPGVK